MAYQTRESSGFGVGNVLVFLSGIGVGLLFAQRPGSETREQISDWIKTKRREGRDLLDKSKEQVTSAKETMTGEGGKEPFYETGKY